MDFRGLPIGDLHVMAAAANEVRECQRVLDKTGDTVVGEILRGHDPVQAWEHYPPGDVYDAESHAQYYYHVHPFEPASSDGGRGEHGHFHTFLRPLGMPPGIAPAPVGGNDALSHLVGISMDDAGRATRLFVTNRWVTGETWYAAPGVKAMLDRFVIDQARPSWPANRWITAMLRLFRPQIEDLLDERDRRVADWRRRFPDRDALEARELEILAEMEISVEDQTERVMDALAAAPL